MKPDDYQNSLTGDIVAADSPSSAGQPSTNAESTRQTWVDPPPVNGLPEDGILNHGPVVAGNPPVASPPIVEGSGPVGAPPEPPIATPPHTPPIAVGPPSHEPTPPGFGGQSHEPSAGGSGGSIHGVPPVQAAGSPVASSQAASSTPPASDTTGQTTLSTPGHPVADGVFTASSPSRSMEDTPNGSNNKSNPARDLSGSTPAGYAPAYSGGAGTENANTIFTEDKAGQKVTFTGTDSGAIVEQVAGHSPYTAKAAPKTTAQMGSGISAFEQAEHASTPTPAASTIGNNSVTELDKPTGPLPNASSGITAFDTTNSAQRPIPGHSIAE